MAKGKIFIGEIMADQVSALNTLKTAMDAQVLKMDDQIAELQTVNTTVAQSVNAGNIAVGTDNETVVNVADVTNATQGTYKEIGKIKVFGNGNMTIEATIKSSTASYSTGFYYSKDGGTTKTHITPLVTGVTYTKVSAVISVKELDEIVLYLLNNNGGTATCQAGSCKAVYDIVNLVADGYIVKI